VKSALTSGKKHDTRAVGVTRRVPQLEGQFAHFESADIVDEVLDDGLLDDGVLDDGVLEVRVLDA